MGGEARGFKANWALWPKYPGPGCPGLKPLGWWYRLLSRWSRVGGWVICVGWLFVWLVGDAGVGADRLFANLSPRPAAEASLMIGPPQ